MPRFSEDYNEAIDLLNLANSWMNLRFRTFFTRLRAGPLKRPELRAAFLPGHRAQKVSAAKIHWTLGRRGGRACHRCSPRCRGLLRMAARLSGAQRVPARLPEA